MDLLASHRRDGRRFEPLGLDEDGDRITVRLAVTGPEWPGTIEVSKVFTFRGDEIVLLEDVAQP